MRPPRRLFLAPALPLFICVACSGSSALDRDAALSRAPAHARDSWQSADPLDLVAAPPGSSVPGAGPTSTRAHAPSPPAAGTTGPRPPTTVPSASSPSPSAAPDKRPRLGAIDQFAYIYKGPAAKGLALGYIRLGTSVPLRSDQPVAGEGCSRGWYAVEPRGYACRNHRTTLDLEQPYFKELASVAPKPGALWPYQYAFSNGAPMYSRVPKRHEWEKHEKSLGAPGSFVQLAEWSAGHEELLVDEKITATDPVPGFLENNGRTIGGGTRDPRVLLWRTIPNGSMLAYAKAFEAEGRVWLLTSDLMIVPADRVRAIRRSTFQGVMLQDGLELPLAWNRAKQPKPKYRRQADGSFVAAADTIPAKTHVPVVDERIDEGVGTEPSGRRLPRRAFLPIRGEPGFFVLESDVTVARARTTLPKGVRPGEKWIEAKILPGTLTAYEGLRPVRSSLFSPGKGGVPLPGHDHTKYATTQTGYFPLEWKDRTATMSNEKSEPKVLWFSDVPHIQYLKAPLAMHVAYWHEDFGNPKSAECVNVSPLDGLWLFDWTEPALPAGWGGIRPGDGNGRSTPVVITAT